MTNQELNDLIILETKKILADSGHANVEVTANANFSDLQLDSLQFIELLARLEEEARVELLDSEFYGIKTISDASELINQKLRKSRSSQD